jgi:AmmeMemoRadiSam system protein B
MRYPCVAGQFYPLEKDDLNEAIKRCFLHTYGVGKLPTKGKSNIKAIISPHAGYIFSGPGMSHVFYEIGIRKTADTYFVIGLSHHGFDTCLSSEDFMTPLGVVKNNVKLTKKISEECSIPIDNDAHKDEHSLEVLLPFLQFVKGDVQIVPIIVGFEKYEDLAMKCAMLKKSIAKYGKDVVFLVSSDFTHYGHSYGYAHFSPEKVKEMDMKAVDLIVNGKSKELFDYHSKTGITICGIYPITALLLLIDFKVGKLLKYYTSSEIMEYDKSSSVSYAAISFE